MKEHEHLTYRMAEGVRSDARGNHSNGKVPYRWVNRHAQPCCTRDPYTVRAMEWHRERFIEMHTSAARGSLCHAYPDDRGEGGREGRGARRRRVIRIIPEEPLDGGRRVMRSRAAGEIPAVHLECKGVAPGEAQRNARYNGMSGVA